MTTPSHHRDSPFRDEFISGNEELLNDDESTDSEEAIDNDLREEDEVNRRLQSPGD